MASCGYQEAARSGWGPADSLLREPALERRPARSAAALAATTAKPSGIRKRHVTTLLDVLSIMYPGLSTRMRSLGPLARAI